MPKFRISLPLIETTLRWMITLLSLWAAYQYYVTHDQVGLASALLSAGLIQLARPLQWLLRIKLPVSWRLVYLGFIIAAMYLGEIHSFFYRFLWWDDFLHTCSAMLISYVAFLGFRLLYGQDIRSSGIRPILPAVCVFFFTVGFGTLWELLEFGADQLLGVNMLKGRDSTIPGSIYSFERALVNTMQDLILDALGALAVAYGAWLQMRSDSAFSRNFGYLITDFLKVNPKLAGQNRG